MGVGPVALKLYDRLFSVAAMRAGQSMCELGSQNMATADTTLAQSARDYMTRLGFDYTCIDIDGKFDAVIIDLNTQAWEQWSVGKQFDIVTNHGTSEHVFDQANCFRFIHAITKPGGIMIHVLPQTGYDGHCFYLYQPVFFTHLARENGYEILFMDTTKDSHGELLSVALRRVANEPFRAPIQS
jgi:SAM-dependent methyltransferase